MADTRLPPRDAAYRLMKYKARFQPDAEGKPPQGGSELMARMMQDPVMLARLAASNDGICTVDEQVRVVLAAEGAPTILHLHYLNFGRQLWKLTNRIGGASAAGEAAALAAKWVVRGLDRSVLEKICFEVFNLTLPEEA